MVVLSSVISIHIKNFKREGMEFIINRVVHCILHILALCFLLIFVIYCASIQKTNIRGKTDLKILKILSLGGPDALITTEKHHL